MLATHRSTILKYDEIRDKARAIARMSFPRLIKKL